MSTLSLRFLWQNVRANGCTTVEFATLTLDADKKPKAKIYRPSEIDALLQKHGLAKKEDTETATA